MTPSIWYIIGFLALVGGSLTAETDERRQDLQTASQDFLSTFNRPGGVPSRSSSNFDADLFNRDQFGNRGGYYPNSGGGCYGAFYQRYVQFLANLFGTRGLSPDFDPYRQRSPNFGRP